jgi:RNA polymerase sigma factor for flagellar operon FliA
MAAAPNGPWRSAVPAVALHSTTEPTAPAAAQDQTSLRTPDDTSPDDLVAAHLSLVGHLVRELISRLPAHVSRDDLVSAGMLALVLSARSYDPARGVPFSRFAAIRIRGALTDELRGMDWASRGVRSKARELDTVRNALAAQLSRVPSRDEVAAAMGVPAADLDAVDADVHRASVMSLQSLTPEQGDELVPTVDDGPEGLLVRREQIGMLRDAVAELPERLRTVVEQYFFAQRKMADIAADLGVTESRVSQLRSEALGMLRAGMRACDDTAAIDTTASRRRAGVAEAYCAAVATRSSLARRLEATTVLGDPRSHPATRRAI